jgi:hypothetical protein
VEAAAARRLWHEIEPLHAVTYFSPEAHQAAADLGLKGFWMGYFACRAAPMGAVAAATVEATFFNFHPARVRRAIPDAWALAEPAAVIGARAAAAAAALRRLLGNGGAERLAGEVTPVLADVLGGATAAGRPLFAANRDTGPVDDPVAALWQLATALREHRGDGHVALLAGADLDGCEVHLLLAADEGVDPQLLRDSRGWSDDDWDAASDRLRSRGLLDDEGRLTAAGRDLRHGIERRTD